MRQKTTHITQDALPKWKKALKKGLISGGVIVIVLCVLGGVLLGLPVTAVSESVIFDDYGFFYTVMDNEYMKYLREVVENEGITWDSVFNDVVEVYDGSRDMTYAYSAVPGAKVEIEFDRNESGFYAEVYFPEALKTGNTLRVLVAVVFFAAAAAVAGGTALVLIKKRDALCK